MEEGREQEEAWAEAAEEVEWAEIGRVQAPREFVYALIANCLLHIKQVFHAIVSNALNVAQRWLEDNFIASVNHSRFQRSWGRFVKEECIREYS